MSCHRLSLRSIVLVLASGCALAHSAEDGPPPAAAAPTGRSCEDLEPAWTSRLVDSPIYGRTTLVVAPGEALLLHSGAHVGARAFVRASDGRAVRSEAALGVMDAPWRRIATVDEVGAIAVRDSVTSELLRETAAPAPPTAEDGWFSSTQAIFSKHGESLLALDCWRRPATGEAVANARAIDLTTGTVTLVSIETACGEGWLPPPILLEGAPASMFVAGLGAGAIAHVRFDDGSVVVARDVLDAAPGDLLGTAHIWTGTDGPAETSVIAAALSPDDRTLAVVGRDGLLRWLDAATLARTADPMQVGLAVANGATYLPSIESPLAFSADGGYLALVGTDGRVSLLARSTGEIVATLDEPFDGDASGDDGWPSAPMALAFTGGTITVAYEGGLARWTCGASTASPPSPAGELDVVARGPSTARIADRLTFEVEARGTDAPAVRWIELDGTQVGGASLSSELSVYVYADPGVHGIQAFADAGTHWGSAAATTFVVTE